MINTELKSRSSKLEQFVPAKFNNLSRSISPFERLLDKLEGLASLKVPDHEIASVLLQLDLPSASTLEQPTSKIRQKFFELIGVIQEIRSSLEGFSPDQLAIATIGEDGKGCFNPSAQEQKAQELVVDALKRLGDFKDTFSSLSSLEMRTALLSAIMPDKFTPFNYSVFERLNKLGEPILGAPGILGAPKDLSGGEIARKWYVEQSPFIYSSCLKAVESYRKTSPDPNCSLWGAFKMLLETEPPA